MPAVAANGARRSRVARPQGKFGHAWPELPRRARERAKARPRPSINAQHPGSERGGQGTFIIRFAIAESSPWTNGP
eukprot:9706682-Lingulodinium_polyedra.AAC.1